MTDPFKNQRYQYSSSSIPHSTSQDFNRPSQLVSSSSSMHSINSNTAFNNDNKQAFVQAHVEANKELIAQLKSNIELLFKGSRIFGQFCLFPFRALRWQCQIHSESNKFHLTPITLMPVFYNLNFHGFATLWKGCFSMAAFTGSKMVIESVISELTSFEKNIEDVNRNNKLYGNICLKFIASAILTPLYSAVIFESVQSGISNENLGLVDLIKETWNRVTGYKYNYRTRLIPFYYLILPTSIYFISMELISFGLETILRKIIVIVSKLLDDKRPNYGVDEVEEEVVETPYLNNLAKFFSQIGGMIALYPIETILNRLIVQGTRTIIDNTDNGYGFIPINTRYDGFLDCFHTIKDTEGIFGFYKGFGALTIEVMLQFAILKLVKIIAYRIYDAEWITRSDNNNIKNLMSSSLSEQQFHSPSYSSLTQHQNYN